MEEGAGGCLSAHHLLCPTATTTDLLCQLKTSHSNACKVQKSFKSHLQEISVKLIYEAEGK